MKALPILFILTIILVFVQPVFGQASKQGRVDVVAIVGELTLSVSGYISPYASIVLTSQGVFLRSAVADSKGYFYISEVLIKKGFSEFCLDAVDFKNIGESSACFSFPPAESSIVMTDIFLPPTLGLYRNDIEAGGTAIAFGYSMPNAKVILHLSDGRIFEVIADSTGYYEFRIEKMQAGTYKLYSEASLEGINSLTPKKQIELRVLTFEQQAVGLIGKLKDKVVDRLISTGLGILWIAIPLIILIIILLLKLFPRWGLSLPHPEWIPNISFDKLFSILPHPQPKKPLHHWWWVGY